MTRRRFFFQITGLTLALVALVFTCQMFSVFQPHFVFSLASVGIFAAVATLLFFWGVKTAVSKDKNAFTTVVMGATFAKMFLAIIMVVVYHRLCEPEGAFFIIPFFIIYFAYTLFETMFLSKLGKIKAH